MRPFEVRESVPEVRVFVREARIRSVQGLFPFFFVLGWLIDLLNF